MNFLLYLIALLVTFGVAYIIVILIESRWEKSAWLTLLWIIGAMFAMGLSSTVYTKLLNTVGSVTNPTVVTIIYFLVYVAVTISAVISVSLICKKLGSEKFWLQILLWYGVAIVGTSVFLHIFKLITSLAVYIDVLSTVLMAITIFIVIAYWKNGDNNGLQYYCGVVLAHVLAVVMTYWVFWTLGIGNMENLALSRGVMMPFILFYGSYLTLAFVLSLKIKPLWQRWSYWVNWLWCAALNALCLLTVILQLAGIITSYELDILRYKNISAGTGYHARVSTSFNMKRAGYTYPEVQSVIKTGSFTPAQAIQIETAMNEHWNFYLTIPKPEIIFPQVYQNNIGAIVNWVVAKTNNAYSNWRLRGKTIEMNNTLTVWEKHNILPEEAKDVISKTTTIDLKDPNKAEEYKKAVEAIEDYNNLSKPTPTPATPTPTTTPNATNHRIYQPGVYIFNLKAGEITDHWIMIGTGATKLNFAVKSSDDQFTLIFNDGDTITAWNTPTIPHKKHAIFKLQAVTDQVITLEITKA